MSPSRDKSATTRRVALGSLGAVGAAIATLTATGQAASDPIFVAIEEHRVRWKAFEDALEARASIERVVPVERRQWLPSIRTAEPPADCTDDPRWIEVQRAETRASQTADDAAFAFLAIEPNTLEGVAALLLYVAACDPELRFPGPLKDDKGDDVEFSSVIITRASTAIMRIAARKGAPTATMS